MGRWARPLQRHDLSGRNTSLIEPPNGLATNLRDVLSLILGYGSPIMAQKRGRKGVDFLFVL